MRALRCGRQQSGQGYGCGKAFGAEVGYGKAEELFADPKVDLVSICVKVPDDRALVLGALAARKHIYCEWPLGRDLSETQELAAAARTAGVSVAIGLQTQMNPAAKAARELVSSGAIGRLLSARIYSTTMAFGAEVEPAMAFAEKAENGVTLVTIQGAHTLDLAIAVLGEFEEASALMTTQFPDPKNRRSGDTSIAFDFQSSPGASSPNE